MFFDPEYPGVPIFDDLDHVLETSGMMAIIAAQRLMHVDAMRSEAMADATRYGSGLTDVLERGVRLELAAALRITEHAAAEMIGMAEALVHRYPAVLDSLARAGITERHAEICVSLLDQVEPELRDDLAAQALAIAEAEPVGTFRRKLRKLIDVARSATLTERHEDALTQRRVVVEPATDGMSWLHLFAPSVEVHAIHTRATAIAKTITARDDETRTLDQARADVPCDLLIEGQVADHPAEARGVRATVVVTVPALALLAHDDADRAARGLEPAVVEGIGPIPLDRARDLCGGAGGWMRVLTHPETGMVLSVGREQYRPPASLMRLVKWRADRCMAPGCGMPASRCEVDHNLAWEHGGETALWNHAPFCKGHHIVKHHGGWRVEQPPDGGGAIRWTSPLGRVYVVQPERRTPFFRPPPDGGDAPF